MLASDLARRVSDDAGRRDDMKRGLGVRPHEWGKERGARHDDEEKGGCLG
jgi:hypothetical protein